MTPDEAKAYRKRVNDYEAADSQVNYLAKLIGRIGPEGDIVAIRIPVGSDEADLLFWDNSSRAKWRRIYFPPCLEGIREEVQGAIRSILQRRLKETLALRDQA